MAKVENKSIGNPEWKIVAMTMLLGMSKKHSWPLIIIII